MRKRLATSMLTVALLTAGAAHAQYDVIVSEDFSYSIGTVLKNTSAWGPVVPADLPDQASPKIIARVYQRPDGVALGNIAHLKLTPNDGYILIGARNTTGLPGGGTYLVGMSFFMDSATPTTDGNHLVIFDRSLSREGGQNVTRFGVGIKAGDLDPVCEDGGDANHRYFLQFTGDGIYQPGVVTRCKGFGGNAPNPFSNSAGKYYGLRIIDSLDDSSKPTSQQRFRGEVHRMESNGSVTLLDYKSVSRSTITGLGVKVPSIYGRTLFGIGPDLDDADSLSVHVDQFQVLREQ